MMKRYYVRIGITRRLQGAYGAKEVFKSLHTRSLDEARVRALAVEAELKKTLARLDRPHVQAPLSPADLARQYQQQMLADDLAQRLSRPVSERELEGASYALTDKIEALHDDPSKIDALVTKVLFDHGQHVTPANRGPYAHALLRAELDVLKTLLARTGSTFVATDADLGPTVDELVEAYVVDRKLPEGTAHHVRKVAARFIQTTGGGRHRAARLVGRADVRRYRAAVLASDRSPSTQKKLLVAMSTLYRWGVTAGLVDSDPFQGLTSVPQHGSNKPPTRLPYTPAQVRYMLTACETLTGARRWIVPLLAYSGARVEEVCGMRAQDVKMDGGIWCLDLEPTKERRLKTRGSARKIPIHPTVIKAGFVVDYVKSLPAEGMLFPDLPRQHAKGKYSVAFGRWFAKWSAGLGEGLDDPRLVLHSLRHSFKRACRDAGVIEELHDQITGHVTAAVGRQYGLGASVKVLAEAVAKVSYEEE